MEKTEYKTISYLVSKQELAEALKIPVDSIQDFEVDYNAEKIIINCNQVRQ